MSSPPSERNVFERLSEPKSTASSRIPRTGRQSPFSTDASGSARTENVSPPPTNVTSAAVSSKLPRKSQTPSQLPTLRSTKQRNSVNTTRLNASARDARSPASMTTPAVMNETKTSPAGSDRDKPLPSPPMAQIIDPDSPPKAQRTLVDAESGSPSESAYPIIRPEHVTGHSERDSATLRPQDVTGHPGKERYVLSPEDVLGHTARRTNSLTAGQMTNLQTNIHRNMSNEAKDGALSKDASNPFFMNRHPKSTAPTDINAIYLANNSEEKDVLTRRSGSQQQTLTRALGDKNPYAGSFHAYTTGAEEVLESPLARKKSAPAAIMIPPRMSSMADSGPVYPKAQCEARPAMASESEWSQDSASSYEEGPDVILDNGSRVRRLYAEAVLRGSSDNVPEIPSPIFSGRPDSRIGRQRSLSGLTDKMSKKSLAALNDIYKSQIKPIFSSGAVPEVPVISSREGAPLVSTPIKPIRSMQPPRKTNTAQSTPSTSPNAAAFTTTPGGLPNSPSYGSEAYDTIDSPIANKNDGLDACNIPRKASQVLGLPQSRPNSAAASIQNVPIKATSPSLASSKTAIANEAHKPISMIRSDDHTRNRHATIDGDMSNLSFSSRIDTTRSNDTSRSRGHPRLRTTRTAIPARGDANFTQAAPSSYSNTLARSMASVGFADDDKIIESIEIEKKVKAKRSFRERFLGRDDKAPEIPPLTVHHKRSFMGDTRSTIAKRLSSKSLPKMNLSSKQTPVQGLKSVLKRESKSAMRSTANKSSEEVNRQAALYSLEASSSTMTGTAPPRDTADTIRVIKNIVNHVNAMSPESSDRLRGLEIAEALVQSVECCKKAEISAAKAREFALDAKLNAEHVEIAMQRLVVLCQSGVDRETQRYIHEYIRIAGLRRMAPEQDA